MSFNPQTDLKIERVVDVPAEKLFKAWTDPKHLMPWFCPKPWKTTDCRIDLKPGGEFYTVMEGPEGQRFAGSSCILEVIPNQKLVWTSSLQPGYRPSENGELPFTCILTFEKEGNGTKYTALALHPTEDTKKQHEAMGFEQGWNIVLDQLVAYIKEYLN